MSTAEQLARVEVGRLLTADGWSGQDFKQPDFHAARGVALWELRLNPGIGFAEYLLDVDGIADGVIEARNKVPRLPELRSNPGSVRKALPPSCLPCAAHCRSVANRPVPRRSC